MTGKEVTTFRLYHDITQKKLALALGVSLPTVGRMEALADKDIPERDALAIEALKARLNGS